MAERPKVPVFPGRNVWRLLRGTDDDPSPDDLPQKAAAFVRFVFRGAMIPTPELIPTGEREWRFEDVRPFRVLSVAQAPQGLGPGRLVADRSQLTETATVRVRHGTKPFYVLVEFWWRGEAKTVDFPAYQRGFFSPTYSLMGADWLLDKASFDEEPGLDPGDESWVEEQGENAEELAKRATGGLSDIFGAAAAVASGVQMLGILALLWYLSKD